MIILHIQKLPAKHMAVVLSAHDVGMLATDPPGTCVTYEGLGRAHLFCRTKRKPQKGSIINIRRELGI